jgi:hypothetical protein
LIANCLEWESDVAAVVAQYSHNNNNYIFTQHQQIPKMKFALVVAMISSAAAFAPTTFVRCTCVNASQSIPPLRLFSLSSLFQHTATPTALAAVNRKEFLTQFTATLGTTLLAAPSMASAAKYGSFGSDSPLVLDPKEAIIDIDVLRSSAVQSARSKIQAYLTGVQQMRAALETQPQTDVGPYLRKEFDFVSLREALNTVNSAFDEDTQRGTDRLIRNIMQDITELETSNRQKEGIPRSEIRLNIMKGKLDKLAKAFGDYLAFSA